ncbi:RNA polymerase sigma factor, partial [Streptomyces hainanensis]|uniref:RNA polymerase sigma factor n=1 Tax=Streptomyces hainanensis TaxID=402648 RepID=UPI001A9D9C4A
MTETGDEAPSDEALLSRVRRGDDTAYGELYRRHVAGVRRYARLCCHDPHLAEDLTAEVFARTLRLVRAGAGPNASVRAYLLTILRRVAAQWGAEGRMEQPVAETDQLATGVRTASSPSEVLAMSRADRSMAARAFRSLPERWRAVLWHTTVENEPVSRVAPLLGLTPNATAVLAFRAREGLRTAYLQAHVSSSLTSQEECREYAGRLGAYARRPSRRRGFRELRRHLDGCARCRSAYLELVDLNATLRGLAPVGPLAWLAATRIAGKSAGLAAEWGPHGAAGAGGMLGLGKVAVSASFALATGVMAVGPVPTHHAPPLASPEAGSTEEPAGGRPPLGALGVPDPVTSAPSATVPSQRRAPESETDRAEADGRAGTDDGSAGEPAGAASVADDQG